MSMRSLAGVLGCVLLFGVQGAAAAQTATKVTMKSGEGSSESILIGEHMARMGMGEQGNYMLLELDGPHIYIVDEGQRSIHEMNRTDAGKAPATAGKAQLERQGAGPEIAGYATEHYRLSVGETRCGDIFVSRKAFAVSGIEPVYRATQAMARQMRSMTAGFGAMGGADVCETADDLVVDQLDQYGMLMRSLDKHGGLETEVVSIEEKVPVDSGVFDLPQGYARTDMNQQMRKAQEMMQNMPSMQEIQELGRMSPEAREEAMRRMQEKMRSTQQQ